MKRCSQPCHLPPATLSKENSKELCTPYQRCPLAAAFSTLQAWTRAQHRATYTAVSGNRTTALLASCVSVFSAKTWVSNFVVESPDGVGCWGGRPRIAVTLLMVDNSRGSTLLHAFQILSISCCKKSVQTTLLLVSRCQLLLHIAPTHILCRQDRQAALTVLFTLYWLFYKK